MIVTPTMITKYIQKVLHGTDWQLDMAALQLMQTVSPFMKQIITLKYMEMGIVYFLMTQRISRSMTRDALQNIPVHRELSLFRIRLMILL